MIEKKEEILKPEALLNMMEDLEEEKKRAEESEQKLQSIIDGSSAIIFAKDLKGRYFLINKLYEKLFHISKAKILGKTDHDVFPKKVADAFRAVDVRVLKANKLIELEETILQDDGIHYYISLKFPLYKKGKAYAVCGIATDITDRKKAKQKLQSRFKIEEIVSKVSSSFINIRDFDSAMNFALRDIGKLTDTSRVYFFIFSDNGEKMSNTHEWAAKGVSPQIKNLQNLETKIFPWWMKKLNKNEVINIENVSKLPIEAKAEKEILEKQDIKSLLVLPVNAKDKLIGYIGFDNVEHTRIWKKEDIVLLRTISEIIGMTLDRKKAEEKLKEISELNKEIIEKLPVGIYTVLPDGKVDYVNSAMVEISGTPVNKFIGLDVFRLPTYKKLGISQKIKNIFKGKSFDFGPVEYVSYIGKKKTKRRFIGIPIIEEKKIIKAMVVVEDLTKLNGSLNEN